MTQSNFDYITINSDSDSDDEEENKFKDKFSVEEASNMLDCNICLQTYYRAFIFFKCRRCIWSTYTSTLENH